MWYHIAMRTFVLDTNLFFNMEAGLGLGDKTEDVVRTMTERIKVLKSKKEAEFLIAPRVVDEFLSFFDDKEQPFIKDFFATVTIKSPHIHDIQVPAAVFYEMVQDIRNRSYRGIGIAEEEMRKAAQQMSGKSDLSRKDFEIALGPVIKNFRDRYRQATRFGFLDSVADLDLIMLAKESDGYLVSADEGVIKWGRLFGVREMPLNAFGKLLNEG